TFDLLPAWLDAQYDSVFGTPLEGNLDTLIRVMASDGELTDTLLVGVTVSPVNDAPVITSLAIADATEDEYFSYHATADDPENQAITWIFDKLPSWLTSNADSAFGAPLEGDLDTTFRIIASDGELTDTLVVSISVTPVNDAPVITSAHAAQAAEDEHFVYHATADDPEDSTLMWIFDVRPWWLAAGADSVFGTPLEGTVDTLFRIIVSDGELHDTLLVDVTVIPLNDPPIITSPASAEAIEDMYFSYHATATDPEDSTLTFTFSMLPDWLSSQADSVFGITPEGILSDSFRVIASDGELADTLKIHITIIPLWPHIVLSDDSLDFGPVRRDSTRVRVLEISNLGADTLEVTELILHQPVFQLQQGPFSLAPQDTEEVLIEFTPAEPILYQDTLTIEHNDPDTTAIRIPMTGQGVKPTISLSATALLFGNVLCQADSTLSFKIHNPGNDTLVIYNLEVSDPVFSFDEQSNTNVNPEDSLVIQVRYAPVDTGNVFTSLVINSNDPDQGQTNVDLSGRGVAPETNISCRYYALAAESGDSVTFAIPITNRGTYPLDYQISVKAFWIAYNWLAVTPLSGSLGPSEIDAVQVSVINSANLIEGDYSGLLVVTTNAAGYPEFFVTTDSIQVDLRILPDGSVTFAKSGVPAGNPEPIVLKDNGGVGLGIILDFIASAGGSVEASSANVTPPVDSSTIIIDPNDLIDIPVYADFYWEIIAYIAGGFAVDIAFDYSRLLGVYNHSRLRLAKRPAFAGAAVPWRILTPDSVRVDSLARQIIALQQSAFSQWTIMSDESDNPFRDIRPPEIAGIAASPALPAISENVTVSANITDESQIQSVHLFYLKGGDDQYTSEVMTLDNSDLYVATIPGSAVTITGLAYYLSAEDENSIAGNTDTFSIPVTFPDKALTTDISESFFPTGYPKDKWRLISVPTELDDPNVLGTIGDELGERTKKTWRIFSLDDGQYLENPAEFGISEGYWLYQRKAADITLSTGAGTSSDLAGYVLTLEPGWNFIGSPYPFDVAFNADQAEFYGPLTYALNGTEGWSDLQTKLKPWGGYAIYNRDTESSAEIVIDPFAQSLLRLVKGDKQDIPGWKLNIQAVGPTYSDVANYIGRIKGATEEWDRFENPEPPYIEGYISLAMERPEWGGGKARWTSDIRSIEETNGVWDIDLFTRQESGPIQLTSQLKGEIPADFGIVLIDLITRETHVLLDGQPSINITGFREEFPYHFKAVAGSQAYVEATVKEILAGLPTDFALSQNYPNPFNPTTRIKYTVPRPEKVSLRIYNILGQEVVTLVNDWTDLGEHEVLWNSRDKFGRDLPSGIYFAHLRAPSHTSTIKMLLLK
ncbi:MAG: choice-of-anchor D domain-containing protein, partial [Candidatus Neomarinimicrobiota bacterium]